MTSDEIQSYINSRYGELSSDEMLELIDFEKNSQIDYAVYDHGLWKMWDNAGREFHFRKRTWM